MDITQPAAITLADIINRYELGLVVIASATEEALSSRVQWVHGSDLKDPAPFLVPRTVLLTTGAQFPKSLSEADAKKYVADLVSAKVVALGFALDVHHTRIPHTLISASEELNFPLFRVPYETPFIQISQTAARMLATKEYERQSWSLDTQRAIARSAITGDAMQAAINTLSGRLARWVALTDASGSLIYTSSFRETPELTRTELIRESRHLLKTETSSHASRILAGTKTHLQTVPGSKGSHGVLAIEHEKAIDHADRTAIELVATLASFYLEHRASLLNERQTVRNVYASLLLADLFEEASAVAAAAGIKEHSAEAIVLNFGPKKDLTKKQVDDIFSVSFEVPKSLCFESDGGSFVITDPEHLHTFQSIVHENSLLCGASNTRPLSLVKHSLAESQIAFGASKRNKNFGSIQLFETNQERNMYAFLASNGSAKALAEETLKDLIVHDKESGDMLLETLRVWLANHGQNTSAAAELGVHRHTVSNRMQTVAEILDTDLSAAEVRADLLISMRLMTNNFSE